MGYGWKDGDSHQDVVAWSPSRIPPQRAGGAGAAEAIAVPRARVERSEFGRERLVADDVVEDLCGVTGGRAGTMSRSPS